MIGSYSTIKTAILAYFSGTGCTKAIVDCFDQQLSKQKIITNRVEISSCSKSEIDVSDLLIIFSPVYAFRLTSVVEKWVKNLPEGQNMPAVIISVSGGGEISPNTACRSLCKRLLKRKGYQLIYEKMLVMPSNFATQAEEQLNLDLITVMPLKVEQIISDILSGEKNITRPKLQDRFFASVGRAEHLGAKIFGVSISASKECNQCGLCIRNCPKKNIRMNDETPKFGFDCMWCLKCIYACPQKALSPRVLKFAVLKNGFDLRMMSEMAYQHQRETDNTPTRNALWQGVIDYLND